MSGLSPQKGHCMDRDVSQELVELEARWLDREQYWARKLGRIRLGVEPIEEQLARYRRTTLALTIVPSIIAAMFLSLFAVFGRADIGLVVVGIFFLPLILFAWIGFKRMERRASAYLAERAGFEREKKRLTAAREVTGTAPAPN